MIRVIFPGFDNRATVKTAIDFDAVMDIAPQTSCNYPILKVGEKIKIGDAAGQSIAFESEVKPWSPKPLNYVIIK